MLQLEQQVALAALRSRLSQPWLWLSTVPAGLPEVGLLQGRGLRLARSGTGYVGDLRCALPLPIPSESLQAIVVQHPATLEVEPFLRECARVLAPGGRLWLFVLNPLSPYRLRWRRHIAGARRPDEWRRSLQRAGLHCPTSARYLGPAWRSVAVEDVQPGRGPWRAVCLLEADKRAAAPSGLIPVKVRWQHPVATI